MRHFIVFSLIVLLAGTSHCQDGEYYWKEYTGTIPDDALEGGNDINGDIIFIGQAKLGEDLVVAPIYSNTSHVLVPSNITIVRVDSNIKILCGSEDEEKPFSWLRANAENLHVILLGKNPVQGGNLKNKGHLHVGRIFYENEVKIGPILSYELNNANLVFVHGDKVLSTDKYELLLSYDAPRARRKRPMHRRGCGRGPQ